VRPVCFEQLGGTRARTRRAADVQSGVAPEGP
jgi:hypothetical protein